jgi:hypothetical protein
MSEYTNGMTLYAITYIEAFHAQETGGIIGVYTTLKRAKKALKDHWLRRGFDWDGFKILEWRDPINSIYVLARIDGDENVEDVLYTIQPVRLNEKAP